MEQEEATRIIICFCREKLKVHIGEEEKHGTLLKEEQKTVKDLVETSFKQLKMWQDVVKYEKLVLDLESK